MDDVKDYQVGQKIDVSMFKAGDVVQIEGISKGKGFAGGVKRYHFQRRAKDPRSVRQASRTRFDRFHYHTGPCIQGTAHGGAYGRPQSYDRAISKWSKSTRLKI